MKIVVAPDKFKGSLTAQAAAEAITRGLRSRFPDAEIVSIPIADGGEGTLTVVAEFLGAETVNVQATGPYGGSVDADFSLAGERAFVEMSRASGLVLRDPDKQCDPWDATTFGTGELILRALEMGAGEIVVGIGGSATNDGGRGMAEALGFGFEESPTGELVAIKAAEIDPRRQAKFIAACDVANPLLGEEGCTRVYGPQKGIAEADFDRHEQRLGRLAEIVSRDVSEVSPDFPGAGAAGGLGFGLMAFCGAKLVSGFDLVADWTGLRAAIATTDLVITGEGQIDAQTLMGKGPGGVAEMAREAGKPVVAIAGMVGDRDRLQRRFDQILALRDGAESDAESMRRAAELLESAAGSLEIELR